MPISTAYHTISSARLDKVHLPLADATGMPNAAYDDPTLFEFERDHVIGKTWAGLTFASELPEKGHAKPIDFMGLPIIVMRNRDNDIKVFHNVCSHRGMVLLQKETRIKGLLSCPYHYWSYDLDGNLKGTPHIAGVGNHTVDGFECSKHNLREIPSAVWMGIIFINLSGDAENFEQFITPLVERWETFTGKGGFNKLYPAQTSSHIQMTVNANWKLAVENYCEAYHLPWVHPDLNTYSPLNQHYNIIANDYLSGQGSYSYTLADVAGTNLPQFSDWPDDKMQHAEYLSVYPNVLLGIQVDHAFAVILQPLAHNQTLEKMELSYIGQKSTEEKYEAARAAVLESWRVVFSEDIFAVEGMQAGRKSPAFDGGAFSPVLDAPSHHFHCWMAKQYKTANH